MGRIHRRFWPLRQSSIAGWGRVPGPPLRSSPGYHAIATSALKPKLQNWNKPQITQIRTGLRHQEACHVMGLKLDILIRT